MLIRRATANLVRVLPGPIISRIAGKYIAGSTIEDAVETATRLQQYGLLSTLDILGEAVADEAQAEAFTCGYVSALAALSAANLSAHVSLKPSALGSLFSWETCADRIKRIAEAAEAANGAVCIDMESAATVEPTLSLVKGLREFGHHNVGTVLQARLYRTRHDILDLGVATPSIRLCKGIYLESKSIAFQHQDEIRRNFNECLNALLQSDTYVAIATHDEILISTALSALSRHARRRDTYEFQMLLGVREDLACRLTNQGHVVRIYVPYGPDWRNYAIRRLHESPQLVGHIAGDLAKRMLPRPSKDYSSR